MCFRSDQVPAAAAVGKVIFPVRVVVCNF